MKAYLSSHGVGLKTPQEDKRILDFYSEVVMCGVDSLNKKRF
jgi:hypothetical protein